MRRSSPLALSRRALAAPVAYEGHQKSGRESRSLGLGVNLDAASVAAPTTRHRFNAVRNDLRFFDGEFAAHAVVVKRAHRGGLNNVKTRQVAARGAAISVCHGFTVPENLYSSFVATTLPFVGTHLELIAIGVVVGKDRVERKRRILVSPSARHR